MSADVDLFRMLILMLPATILTYHFVHKDHDIMRWVGALFAHLWQFQWRLILFALGIQLGLWEFSVSGVLLYGVPVDIILGAGLLFGALPRILVFSSDYLVERISVLLVLDVGLNIMLMPMVFPSSSLPFLLLVSCLVIVPSQLLAHWTEYDSHLYGRTILQNTGWSVLLLWLFPSVIFSLTNDSWAPFLQRPLHENLLYLLPMILPALLLFGALYEFAKRGRGTAFPYDAPKFLVTTGVYRYISNPMQLGIVLMMFGWGAILESYLVIISSGVALVLFVVFKNVCNGSCRIGLSDPDWQRYQASVPKWIPFRL